jgi:hypothetical protein
MDISGNSKAEHIDEAKRQRLRQTAGIITCCHFVLCHIKWKSLSGLPTDPGFISDRL